MKKSFFLLLVFSSVILYNCSQNNTTQPSQPEKEVVKIGVLYSWVGQWPIQADYWDGLSFAEDEIISGNIIPGKNVKLIYYNCNHDSLLVKKFTDSLIIKDSVCAIIGFYDSDIISKVMPIIQSKDIIYISADITNPIYPKSYKNNLFITNNGDNVEAATAAEFAFKELNARSAYILYDNSRNNTIRLKDYFKTRFTELGGNIIFEDQFVSGIKNFDKNFETYDRLTTKPDIIYVANDSIDSDKIIPRFSNFDQPLIGSNSLDIYSPYPKLSGIKQFMYFTSQVFIDEKKATQRIKDFIKGFENYYLKETLDLIIPPSKNSILGYDALMFLANVISRSPSLKTNDLRNTLFATKNYQGLTGLISFSQNNNIPVKSIQIVKCRGSQLDLVEEYSPEKVPEP